MKPPTVEEVRQYADKLGYTGFDAENFVDKHEMIGWVYVPGKDKKAVPITDWKAAVRYWRRMDVKWGRVSLSVPPVAPKPFRPWTPRMNELSKKISDRKASDEEVAEFIALREENEKP